MRILQRGVRIFDVTGKFRVGYFGDDQIVDTGDNLRLLSGHLNVRTAIVALCFYERCRMNATFRLESVSKYLR